MLLLSRACRRLPEGNIDAPHACLRGLAQR